METEDKKIYTKISTIESFEPLFRDNVEAEKICLSNISWMDYDLDNKLVKMTAAFDIVRQKEIDTIGDKVVYILPDSCIPDNEYFKHFLRPNDDEKKCMLGNWMVKNGVKIGRRVRAKKFNNFYKKDSSNTIYSNGILINFKELPDSFKFLNEEQLQEKLGVCKFEQEEQVTGGTKSGMTESPLPEFLKPATDEVFAQSPREKQKIEAAIERGETLGLRRKKDGSSITMFEKSETDFGVCSRNLRKKLEQSYIESYEDVNSNSVFKKRLVEITLPWYKKVLNRLKLTNFKPIKTKVWACVGNENKFYTNEQILNKSGFVEVRCFVQDAWVDAYTKHEYNNKTFHDALLEYCTKHNLQLAISGELIGKASNGSGNPRNPDRNLEAQVKLYDLFDISGDKKVRLNSSNEHNLERFCQETGMPIIPIEYEAVFTSFEEVVNKCKELFVKIKKEEKIDIEGFVVRTKNSNLVSCKVMNEDYDSKK